MQMEMKKKKAGVAIAISDKIDFKTKTVIRDKEGCYIIIKGSIHKEDITLVNTYAPNIGASTYIKQLLTNIKGEIDSNTLIVGDFNTPMTAMNRASRQKINRETATLTDTLDQMDLIGIFRLFYPKAAEFTFISCAHGHYLP